MTLSNDFDKKSNLEIIEKLNRYGVLGSSATLIIPGTSETILTWKYFSGSQCLGYLRSASGKHSWTTIINVNDVFDIENFDDTITYGDDMTMFVSGFPAAAWITAGNDFFQFFFQDLPERNSQKIMLLKKQYFFVLVVSCQKCRNPHTK